MNAIRREATPEDMQKAAEVIIPQAELDRLWAGAQQQRAKDARRRTLGNLGRVSVIVALAGACIAEGVALAALAPLVRVEPVFVYLREDGTHIASLAWEDMPSDAREANVLNVLSEYVRLREGWSSGEAQRAWETVSALSSKQVREQFQGWFRKEHPESPQRIYGEKASVRIVVTDAQKDPVTPEAYRIYFDRIERTADGDGRSVPMVASLRYRTAANPKAIPWWQRIQFNGPAIAVWEYPGAVPNGVLPR